MKNYVALFSVCTIGFASLNASAILSAKSPSSPPATIDPRSPNELNLYRANAIGTGDAYSISVGYVGGYYGPLNTVVAQGGVSTNGAASPNTQDYVQTDLTWTDGFRLGVSWSHNAFNGPLLALDYVCLLNNPQTGPAVTSGTETTAAADITYRSTMPVSRADGSTAPVYFAQAEYTLNSVQQINLATARALLQNDTTSLLLLPGISFLYVSHEFNAKYNQQGSSTLTVQNMEETRFSGGPSLKLLLTKLITRNFGLMGNISAFGHAATTNLTSSQELINPNTSSTYGWNTTGKKPLIVQGAGVSLGFYHTYEFKNKSDLAITGSWDLCTMPNSTFVTAPGMGPNALQTAPLISCLVDVSVAYRF